MGTRHRVDGNLIRNLPPLKIINPYVMRGRNESIVYSAQELVLNKTLEFIRTYNRGLTNGSQTLAPFHVILCAIVRALAQRPQLNRFVSGHRLYQRNRIQISFIVKKELSDEGEEANAKITFRPDVCLPEIIGLVNSAVKGARFGSDTEGDKEIGFFSKFPRFLLKAFIKGFKLLDYYGIAPKSMIESDPLYTSIYLANLGSVGLDAPFHHLYEWGNASLFIALGKIHREARLNLDGTVRVDDILRFHVSFDDRVSEGIYGANAFLLLKGYVENPEQLLEPPSISQKTLDELMLEPVKG